MRSSEHPEAEGTADEVIPLPPETTLQWVNRVIDPFTQVARVAVFAAFIWLWKYAVDNEWIDPLFAAAPGETFTAFRELFTERLFWEDLIVTLREALLGWGFGSSAGVVVGLVLGRWARAAKAFGPFLTFFNATPKIALAPIFILWFGIGESSKIFTAAIAVFFIVQVPTQAASALTDADLDVMAKTMGANQLQRFRKIVLPGILPAIFGALRLAAVISLLVVVFTEFIASRRGLGQRLIASTNAFEMDVAFAIMAVLAIMALVINAVIGILERRFLRWQETRSGGSVAML
ncbi:MAG: ABC transporter permease [Actinomycetota bacterium]